MYICYIKDRQDLDFMCLQDIEDGKQITLFLKAGVVYITITILTNSNLFVPNIYLNNQSYSNKPSYEKVISNKDYRNLGLNVQSGNVRDGVSSINLITKLRSGGDNLPENPDRSLDKVNESLKELSGFDKLQKSLASKSGDDSRIFNGKSFNKIVIGIIDKMEPLIGNPKFLRILAETKKPVKSELSVSVQSSNPKPQKNSVKGSPSIFAEALVPINPHRWPAFAAGSAMSSDMPDLKDKLQTPFDNLRVAKEYLETSQSDIQWRDRVWQVAQDTATINIVCEQDNVVGSFGAGAASNKIADGYMDEMVVTEVNKNYQEKLNLEMFKQTAREQGKDVSKVRGTGLMREFVPDFMQEDICERPERNARPNSWEDNSYRYDDESSFN